MLLRENASNFEFQGRTELAPNSDATLFSAFALREGEDTVEVVTTIIIVEYQSFEQTIANIYLLYV